jgi:N-acetyl-1-D-myo-inositol-2-amino-2-deoxy-alpha-D-glucopyranoside deacetylase
VGAAVIAAPTAAGGGLLAVHAHPDDETLVTGALLAAWARSGRPVTVVTCTRGELGEVIGPDLAHLGADGQALAAHRETELGAALAALGVRDHLFLDDRSLDPGGRAATGAGARFSDSGMAWAGVGRAGRPARLPDGAFVAVPLDAAADRLARLLRARRPHVVVTYEPGGGYGHPDHVRAHQVTMRALELAADPRVACGGLAPHAPGALLWSVVDRDALRRAYRTLPDLPAVRALLDTHPELTLPDPAGPLPSLAVPATLVDVQVDLTAVLHPVLAALAAHRTQVRAIGLDRARAGAVAPADRDAVVVGWYALSNDVLAPLLSREQYRRAAGG